jgi:hypothetical protein
MYKVPGTMIVYKRGDHGTEVSIDGGETWSFTFRSMSEVREMHPTLTGFTPESDNSERELFGETMDEPIPDEFWELIDTRL